MSRKPKVLIIYKRSPLLSAGTSIAAANLRFRQNHACHYATLRKVEATLKKLGINAHQHLRGMDADHKGADIIISVGGDGTFLDAARHSTEKQLILGVNSDPSWSVGKFCAANADNFEDFLLKTIDKPKYKKVYKVRVVFQNEGKRLDVECINDVLVCHANPAAMSRYTLSIGSVKEEQRSSGVWFASAAGSTGAIASAGGVKLPIDSRLMQYMPREMYHCRKDDAYKLRGGVIKVGEKIHIISKMPHGRIFLDGAHIKYPLTFGKGVQIGTSPHYIKMISS